MEELKKLSELFKKLNYIIKNIRSINMTQFKETKMEIVNKVLPHLIEPNIYGPTKISMVECAILMSKDEDHRLTPIQITKIEKTALMKLGDILRSYGINKTIDCIPLQRN
jgi:hypothetical protein